MSDAQTLFPVSDDLKKSAHITTEKYAAMYKESIEQPDIFWAKVAERVTWFQNPTKIKNTSFNMPVSIKWYEDGVLNVSYNCIDRHLPAKANDVALIWESDDPNFDYKVTYQQLKDEVCKLANALKVRGVKKGDRVTIYMPMVPEAVYAMLACTRIGAVHSVVFGGFSPTSLSDRIQDCKSDIVITADEGMRGGKVIPLKANVDEALKSCPNVKTVIVFKRTDGRIDWHGDQLSDDERHLINLSLFGVPYPNPEPEDLYERRKILLNKWDNSGDCIFVAETRMLIKEALEYFLD